MAKIARQQPSKRGSPKSPLKALYGTLSKRQFDSVLDELRNQTDRGAAVIGAAFLEWKVRQSIRKCMPYWDNHGDCLFGKELKNGSMSFIDLCRMAYCLGLIGPIGFRDLERIGQIRNRFAHNLSVTSFFGDEAVAQRCRDLETAQHLLDPNPGIRLAAPKRKPTKKQINATLRQRFDLTVRVAFLGLDAMTSQYHIEWPKIDTKPLLFW